MWRDLISKELLLPFESWEKVRTFANSSLCLAAITVITQRVQFTTTGKRNSLNVDNLAPFLARELATRNICPPQADTFFHLSPILPFFPSWPILGARFLFQLWCNGVNEPKLRKAGEVESSWRGMFLSCKCKCTNMRKLQLSRYASICQGMQKLQKGVHSDIYSSWWTSAFLLLTIFKTVQSMNMRCWNMLLKSVTLLAYNAEGPSLYFACLEFVISCQTKSYDTV